MNRLIVITGASRGIGKQIAIEMNKSFDRDSIFLLIARDINKLIQVKDELEKQSSSNKIIIYSFDFSNQIPYLNMVDLLQKNLKNVSLSNLKELYVFYNHGTLKIENILKSCDEAQQEFQINVLSVWTLLSSLKHMFPTEIVPIQFHVNISSLWASLPTVNVSTYNTTRAAREMLFKCLALEDPKLRVLNYQPGPVYTNMLGTYVETINTEDEFRKSYHEGKLVTTEQTSANLIGIITENTFKSGSIIDYFDKK